MGLRRVRYKIRMLRADARLRKQDIRLLKGDFYDTISQQTEGRLPQNGGSAKFAIVAVHIAPDELFSLKNLCLGLHAAGYNILMVSSSKLRPELAGEVLPLCHWLIERTSVGRDFGSYKIGIEWLQRRNEYDGLEELLLANDSMYWPSTFSNEIKRLGCISANWKCLFEHMAIFPAKYHTQSYFQVFGSAVLRGTTFREYWKKYVPYSDREHAISNGEVGLAKALLADGHRPYVLYSATAVWNELERRIVDGNLDPGLSAVLSYYDSDDWFVVSRRPSARKHEEPLGGILARRDMVISRLRKSIAIRMTEANPTHSAGLLCNVLFGAPLKRDISYRIGEPIGMVVYLASGFSPEEKELLQRSLVLKGPRKQLTRFQNYLMDKGRL